MAGARDEKRPPEAVQVALINAAVGCALPGGAANPDLRLAACKYLHSLFTAATPPGPEAEAKDKQAA